jgi:hypothetical protein
MLLRTVVLHRVIISPLSPVPSLRKSCMPGHNEDKLNLEPGGIKMAPIAVKVLTRL